MCGKHCAHNTPRVDVVAEVQASMQRMIARRPERLMAAIQAARKARS